MNSKDREELVVLKTDMNYVKVNIDKLSVKLDKFIECADNKYATKDEVSNIQKDMDDKKQTNHSWIINVVGWCIVIAIFLVSNPFS